MQAKNQIPNPSQPQPQKNAPKSVLPNPQSAALNQRTDPSTNLPPMAAALFANAEREEREKRFQRTGIIDQVAEVEDDSFTSSSSGPIVEGADGGKLRAAQTAAAAAAKSQHTNDHRIVEETNKSNQKREEHYKKEKEEWMEDKCQFELELKHLTVERDELAQQSEDRNNVSHATRMMLGSIAEKVVGWTRRISGGGRGVASADDDDDDNT